jgi:hypothetical protein
MTWESLIEIGETPTDESIAQRIRAWRNEELKQTDWTQVADAPVSKAAWATYRQQLRDMTASTDPKTWVFPVRP